MLTSVKGNEEMNNKIHFFSGPFSSLCTNSDPILQSSGLVDGSITPFLHVDATAAREHSELYLESQFFTQTPSPQAFA